MEATTLSEFFNYVNTAIKSMYNGGRRRILVPKNISHDGEFIDWDTVEEIQMRYRGYSMGLNTFVTLRFDQENDSSDVIVDICVINADK